MALELGGSGPTYGVARAIGREKGRLALEAHALRAADSFSQARDEFDRLERRLQSGETLRMTNSDLESFVEKEGRELLRQLLQAHLDLRAAAKVAGPVVGADGVERTHRREGERKLKTLLGGVTVNREGFGARGKPTLFPLDADLNPPYSPPPSNRPDGPRRRPPRRFWHVVAPGARPHARLRGLRRRSSGRISRVSCAIPGARADGGLGGEHQSSCMPSRRIWARNRSCPSSATAKAANVDRVGCGRALGSALRSQA